MQTPKDGDEAVLGPPKPLGGPLPGEQLPLWPDLHPQPAQDSVTGDCGPEAACA